MDIFEELEGVFKEEEVIKNWTKAHGYFGDDIIIKRINPKGMIIEAPNSKTDGKATVTIPKRYFVELYKDWQGYMEGKVKRNKLRDKTIFARYLIDIFHELDERKGKK